MSDSSNLLTRAAQFEPSSFSAEKKTVSVVFSTGADVMRSDWEGPFVERLSMDPAAVDLSVLKGGPVLDNHDRYSGVRSILGIVEDASVDGKRGLATVRFSDRPEVQGVVSDVQSGIIRNVSAGYTVQQWEISKRADGVRIKTATRWKPAEISFTPLAADTGAQTRSKKDMNEELQQQIRTLVQLSGLTTEFAEGLITRNVASIEEARTAVFSEAAKRTPVIDNRQPAATITRDGNDTLVTRMADGLLARVNPRHKPEQGREFIYTRIPDIARRCLQERGLSVLGSPAEILTRAMHTTSDFSAVLSEVFNKNLLILGSDPMPITQIFRRATVSDFRNRHVLEISDGPGLEKINEGGEIHFGTITDKELASYRIDTYAKGFSISFQALQNDDINALSDISAKMSRGARQWFASFLVDTIIANPRLADGKAVFHADHNNLADTLGPPADSTIATGKSAIRLQTDLTGNPLNIAPRYILAPVALEGAIDRLLAVLYPQQPADAVVAARTLVPVVEGRFDVKGQTDAWYLFADPASAPIFEVAELQGFTGPQVEVRQGFETIGVDTRVVWHVGAGAVDSRGGWKNPGK